jgi:hypothetical protein
MEVKKSLSSGTLEKAEKKGQTHIGQILYATTAGIAIVLGAKIGWLMRGAPIHRGNIDLIVTKTYDQVLKNHEENPDSHWHLGMVVENGKSMSSEQISEFFHREETRRAVIDSLARNPDYLRHVSTPQKENGWNGYYWNLYYRDQLWQYLDATDVDLDVTEQMRQAVIKEELRRNPGTVVQRPLIRSAAR